MYFVTIGRKPYVLFCLTQSERGALALTDKGIVEILEKSPSGEWQAIAQWDSARYSHTDFMVSLKDVQEPATVRGLLDLLPAGVLA